MCGRNRRDSRKATVNIFSGDIKDGNKTSNTVTELFILYAEINPWLGTHTKYPGTIAVH